MRDVRDPRGARTPSRAETSARARRPPPPAEPSPAPQPQGGTAGRAPAAGGMRDTQGRALCQLAVAALPSGQGGRLPGRAPRRAVAAPAGPSPRAPAAAQPRPRIPWGRTETAGPGGSIAPSEAGGAHVPLGKGGPDVEADSSAGPRPTAPPGRGLLSSGERCGRRTAGAVGAAEPCECGSRGRRRGAKGRCARPRRRRSSCPRTRVVVRGRAARAAACAARPRRRTPPSRAGRGAGLLGGTGRDTGRARAGSGEAGTWSCPRPAPRRGRAGISP